MSAPKDKHPSDLPHLTHVGSDGHVAMVDVSDKAVSVRHATACATLRCSAETRALLTDSTSTKGEALVTAKLAGILAAKKTAELIPLCHPLGLDDVAVDIAACDEGLRITAVAKTTARTGVEMEAMMAASVAALTLYDMGKGVERGMIVDGVMLMHKTGGRSGTWTR